MCARACACTCAHCEAERWWWGRGGGIITGPHTRNVLLISTPHPHTHRHLCVYENNKFCTSFHFLQPFVSECRARTCESCHKERLFSQSCGDAAHGELAELSVTPKQRVGRMQ